MENRTIRRTSLLLIGMVSAGFICAIQIFSISLFRPAWDLTLLICLSNLAVYLWIRTISRMRPYAQAVAIAILILINAATYFSLRLDGFSGDGRLILVWSWREMPDENLLKFSPLSPKDAGIANLTTTRKSDWPCFQGADRSGRVIAPNFSTNWHTSPPKELWRRPVGRGWSSFAVVGEFCVTQEQRQHEEMVVCYELRTGIEVWAHRDPVRFDEVTSGAGPRATPAIHNGRVYTLGATGILNCLDGGVGRVIWTKRIDALGVTPLFGFSSSPLISGPYIYITPGGPAGSLVAFDHTDGRLAWTTDVRKSGYSSPVVLRTKESEQILVFDALGLHGHDSNSGRTLWSFAWGDNSDERVNVCQPALIFPDANDSSSDRIPQILISSGYGRGCSLVSLARLPEGKWTTRSEWQSKALRSKFSSIVVRGRFAFGLDQGILTCISLNDGNRKWKGGHYGYGQLILVNDLLLIQAESGMIALVNADPHRFDQLATLNALSERTWNYPVVAGRLLLVRNDREAACYELPKPES